MAVKAVQVIFPQKLVQEPVIFNIARISGVTPAITSAKIDEYCAEFVLDLQGSEEQIEHAIRLFQEKGTIKILSNH
ncbi:MAG TPA: NIL domain-containing protein [bacterium]|nr:NIL domain-containing protein [bacterium]